MSTLPPITSETIKAYQDEIAKNQSPATAKRKAISLNRFFDWAAGQGHIPVNPVAPKGDVNAFNVTPKKGKASVRTWAVVAITSAMAVLIFLLLYELKFPIPFIKSFAQESSIQTLQNQNTASVIPSGSPVPGTTIPANSAVVSSWNLYAKLKLTDASGNPMVGAETLTFKLFDAPENGKVLYTSDPQNITTDANGSVLISLSNVPSDVFFQNNTLYLEPELGSGTVSARIPASSANVAANLGGFFPANPDAGAGPLTVPVVDATGALVLASQSPAVKAKEGNLLIEGQTVTVKTTDGGGGNIEFNPDGNGYAHFLFEGNHGNFLNAQGPNLTTGSLYYGMVPNNATGYDLIKLQSGAPKMTTRFRVDALGNTFVAGNESVAGNLTVSGITNNSSYNQTSGNFTISQNAGDFASINKTLTSGGALSDVLTLTLDERGKPATANSDYSTLVLNRYDGSIYGAALKVNSGNAIFNGQLQLGRFDTNPSAIGVGSLIYNTTSNTVLVWDGSAWVTMGAGGSSSFDAITSGTNTTASMVVGSGASLDFTGTGTIDASNVTCTGCISNSKLADSTITFAGDLGSSAISLGGTENIVGSNGIATSQSGSTLTVTGKNATTSTVGVASFDPSFFTVSLGNVSVLANSLDFAQFKDAMTLDAATNIATAGLTLSTSGTGSLNFASTGQVTFAGNVDATNGLDVTGANLTVGGANFSVNQANGDVTTAGNVAVNGGSITSSAATTNIFTNAGNTVINVGPSGAVGSIAFSGGSADTGCTLNGVTGDLSCSGNIISAGSSSGFWTELTGALYPTNNTVDVLIGADSTGSAKFAFKNILTGTPTLDVSAQATNIAVRDNTTNALQILEGANPYLAINTGNGTESVSFGNITTNPAFNFLGTGTTTLGGNLTFSGAGGSAISNSTAATNLTIDAGTSGQVQIGGISTGDIILAGGSVATGCTISNTTGNITCSGDLSTNSGNLTTSSVGTATVFNTNATTLNIGNAATTVSIGNAVGTTTINNASTVAAGNLTVQGTTGITESGTGAALTFSGTGTHAIANSSAGTDLTIDAGTTGAVNIAGISTGDVNIAGGSGGTGCTIQNSTGSITCQGDLSTNSGNLTTSSTTANVFTNATTLGIGAVSGTTTINNALAVTGATNLNGNSTFGDATSDTITFTGRVNSNINPSVDNTYDLGSTSPALRWANIHAISLTQGLANNQVCDSSGFGCPAAGVNYWGEALGALYPTNSSVDVLIGSDSTSSAKFAFTGVDGGLPTASIAGDIANVSTYLTGDGNLSTTNARDLTLGSTFTGNVIINSRGSTALTANGADVTIAGNETVQGTTGITESGTGAGLTFSGTGTHAIANSSAGTVLTIDAGTTGAVNIAGVSTGDVNIAGGSGSTGCTIENSSGNLTCSGDGTFNGNDIITTTAAAATVFNTAATSLSLGGAAGTINLQGTSTSTVNIGPTGSSASSIVLSGGSGDTGCTLDGATGNLVCSGNITATGDLVSTAGNLTTTSVGTATVFNTNAITLNIGGAATAVSIGNASGTSTINNALAVTGDTNLNGNSTFGNAATDSITFTGRAASSLLPITDNLYDLGSTILRFANIHGISLTQGLANNQVCDSSGFGCPAATVNYWGETSGGPTGGVLFPLNNTVDVLIGSDATTSAKFAFTGVDGGLPTASIAGDISNVATFLTGDGNLSTTNARDLTLGGTFTGNVILNSRGSTALTANGADVTIAGNTTVQGTTGITESGTGANLTFSGTGTHAITNSSAATDLTIDAGTTGQVQIGGISIGDVLLAGGSGGTGCTITNSTGALTCTNNITAGADLVTNSGNLTTPSVGTATVFNANATTLNIGGAATTVSIGNATGTTTINNASTVAAGNLTVQGTTGITESGTGANLTFSGTGTHAISNSSAATDLTIDAGTTGAVNIAGTSTGNVNIAGGSGGTGCTIVNSTGDITCSGDGTFNGNDIITTTAAAATVFNTAATSLSLGGAAGTINLQGTSTSTVNVGPAGSGASSIVFSGGSGDTGCTLDGATGNLVCSGNITATGDLTSTAGNLTTTSVGTATVFNTNATTLNIGGAASTINLKGTSTSTVNIGPTGSSASSVVMSGGSGDTGCTLDGATGNFTCTGTISGVGSTNYWAEALGALYPTNSSVDVLIGSDSTGSAKFAFKNILTGTPTLDISAQATNIAVRDNTTAALNILEGANSYLAINTNNTTESMSFGNTTTNPAFNFLGSGTTTLGGNLSVSGTIGITESGTGAGLTFSGTGTHAIANSSAGTDLTIDAGTTGAINIGSTSTGDVNIAGGSGGTGCTITNSTGALTCTNNITAGADLAANSGNLTTPSVGTANLFNTNATTLNVGGAAGTINIKGTTTSVVNIGPTGSSASSIVMSGGNGDTGCTLDGATGNLTCSGVISGTGTSTTNFWNQTLGALYPANNGVDVLIGADSTGSAKFAFTNILTGTPTLDVSAQATNIAVRDNTTNALQILEGANQYLGVNTNNGTETLALNAGASGTVNIAGISTGDVNIAGGSGSTGCTIENSSGNLTCSGDGTFNGNDIITTTAAAATVFNTTATSLSLGGAAGTLNLQGASSATVNIGNSGGTTALNFTSGTGAQTFTSATTTGTGTSASLAIRNAAITSGDLIYANAGSPSTFAGNFLKLDNAGTTQYSIDSAGNASESGSLTLGNGSVIKPAYGPLTLDYKSGADTWASGLVIKSPSGDVDIAGGFGSTGCTVTNSNGNLSCDGTITASGGISASSVSFAGITTGNNTSAAMVVDAGATLNYTSTGTINASSLEGKTWEAPGTIGSSTPNSGAFTSLSSSGTSNIGQGTGVVNINSSGSLSLTGALNSTWTLGATHSLSLTTSNFNIAASGLVTLAGNLTPDLTTPAGNSLTIDSGTTGAINIGTGANAKTITIGNSTTTSALAFTSGTGSQTFTSSNASGITTGSSFVFSDPSLTVGTGLYVNETSTPVANTATTQNLFNTTYAQGTSANTNGFVGLGVNFTDASTVAGNTEYAAQIQNQASTGSPTDHTIASLLRLDNADTATGNLIAVTDGLLITNSGAAAAGIVNGITIGSGTQPITNGLKIGSTGVTTDILLQNGETIDNATDGTINLGTTTLKLTGGTTLVSDQTSVSLFNATTTTLNIGLTGGGASSIVMSGGSGDTGCTLDGSNGNFTCTGTISGGSLTATSVPWSGLTDPTASLSLTMPAADKTTFTEQATTQTGFTWTSSTLTSGMLALLSLTGSSAVASATHRGSLLSLSSSTTGFAAGTQTLSYIHSNGTNDNTGVTVQGLTSNIENTGTTSTNIAAYLSATGASTNYALIAANGNVGIGDTSPLAALTVGSGDLFQVDGATGNITTAGDLAVNGNDITSGGDLTITPAGGQVILPSSVTLNAGGISNKAYNAFAEGSDSPVITAQISSDRDLFVGGNLEIKGQLILTGHTIYNVTGSTETGTISFATDPAAVNSYNTLGNGSYLINNDANAGIAALMVRQGAQNSTADIIDATSSAGTNVFKVDASGNVTIRTGDSSGATMLTAGDGTGKINVGTVDPPYTINGAKFATYLAGMVGVKEETTGNASTNEYVPGVGYRSVIDFNSLPVGSDLWLFSKATDIKDNMDKLVALLTPSSSTKVWYEVDKVNSKLAIYSARPTDISYRLTGPRFDSQKYPNQRTSSELGFVVNNPDSINNSPVVADVQQLASFVLQKVSDGVYTLKDPAGVIVDGVESIGNFVAGNIRAGIVNSQLLIADSIEAASATINNLTINNQLIAPMFATNLISPIPGGTDVTVKIGNSDQALGTSQSGKLAIQDGTGNEVASIDSAGNATFSGVVRSQNIDQIQAMLNQVASDQSVLLAATSGANLSASGSANLSQLITSDLFVTGHAAISSLLVNDNLSVGNINSLSGPLKIQSLAMAPVEIMDGLVTIDTHGNVQIAGDLNVAGKITTPELDTGVINATGSATFSSLSTTGLVIGAPDATVSGTVTNGQITTNSSIGKAIIPAGVTEITIASPKVTDYSLVYVTPTSDTQNNVLYVKSKQNGSFVVGFTNSVPTDVSFNWWIVQIQ